MLCFVFYNTFRLFFDHAEWLILDSRKLADFFKNTFREGCYVLKWNAKFRAAFIGH